MKKISFLVLLTALTGCVSNAPPNISPKVSWYSSVKVDEFSDTKSCFITVGSLYTRNAVFTYTNHYYPYIEIVNGDLRLGVRSGGKYPIPVGDIQLRIDNNNAWTITQSETPLSYSPTENLDNIMEYKKNLSNENQKLMEETYKSSMDMVAKSLSPFTATNGKKAHNILKEMLNGKKLKYRIISLNQTSSTTGEYDLDASFKNSLIECGITKE